MNRVVNIFFLSGFLSFSSLSWGADDFLEDKNICSTNYVEIKKTAISYYMSEKTVSLYKRLFELNNIPFSENIYILTSLYPVQDCPAPFNEIVRINDYLVITEQNYILFFKKSDVEENKNVVDLQENNWSTYCHKDNASNEFDGTSHSSCFFSAMNIGEAYNKLKKINESSISFLHSILPVENETYKIDSGLVDYKWNGDKSLTISIKMENELINYIFKEQSSGTSLLISSDSQYW